MTAPAQWATSPQDATQHWDPNRYRKEAGFVADLGVPVLELLNPKPGERILDLGCGDGRLTQKIKNLGSSVLGIDASEEQIAQAQADGLDAEVMDAHRIDLPIESFDAAFSNAALHWMKDIRAVLEGVHRVLKPGGRFVGEFGGAGNVKALRVALRMAVQHKGIDPDAVDPWYFPEPDAFSAQLAATGFKVCSTEQLPRPTPLPGDITGWLDTFAESFLGTLSASDRAQAIADVTTALQPILQTPEGGWTADYVRLRFEAVKQ